MSAKAPLKKRDDADPDTLLSKKAKHISRKKRQENRQKNREWLEARKAGRLTEYRRIQKKEASKPKEREREKDD